MISADLGMKAVGRAAFGMVQEVRRQFREIPGLMEGTAKADTARCVEIATRAALKGMIVPGPSAALLPPLGRRPPAHDRLRPRQGGARRLPRRGDIDGSLPGAPHGQRGRSLGQRQEIHRGGPPGRQGVRVPQAPWGFPCGLVGLPNAGKSTLFTALTGADTLIPPYPFSTLEPRKGVVPVPDDRLDGLAAAPKPATGTPAHLEVMDIAGRVEGARRGEGLGNQVLSPIRARDALPPLRR